MIHSSNYNGQSEKIVAANCNYQVTEWFTICNQISTHQNFIFTYQLDIHFPQVCTLHQPNNNELIRHMNQLLQNLMGLG